jgi:hypothetical protein
VPTLTAVSGAGSALRRRAAAELAVLAALTTLYVALLPRRPSGLDVGLALLGLALVGLTARETRARFWGPAPTSPADRRRHCLLHMLVGTAAVALLFAVVGAALAVHEGTGVAARLLRPTLLAALILFVPWAAAQQTLFQFYVLGRLRALLPGTPPAALAALNGLLFGLVHVPEWDVTLITVVGGAVWSWNYLGDRCLAPLALSHAVMGATYFHWVRGRDLGGDWLRALGF